jgi:cell wall-associated NlpC family hydrolase
LSDYEWFQAVVFHMFYRRATNTGHLPGLTILAACLAISGCAGSKPATRPDNSQSDPVAGHRSTGPDASRAASIASQQVGIAYRYGGADSNGFDCSGLVYYAYSNAGTRVARTTAGLWQSLQPVPRDELEVGDVLFFNIDGKVAHVGMYLGRGRFVHAPSSGRSVVVADLDSDFYRSAFVRGGRTRR